MRFLIGPNGAGKTTLLDIVTGKTKASSGKVMFNGRNITRRTEHGRVRRGIARKFQTPSVFPGLTVHENLEAAIGFRTWYGRLLLSMNAKQVEKVEHVMETVGLRDLATTPAAVLSHGQKQWLEIGMLLTQDPKLLLLDEPVAGMSRRNGSLNNHVQY